MLTAIHCLLFYFTIKQYYVDTLAVKCGDVHDINHTRELGLLPSVGWEMSTGQWAVVVFYEWEGNRRSGAVPTMCHRLCGKSTAGSMALTKEDEHPAYTCLRSK